MLIRAAAFQAATGTRTALFLGTAPQTDLPPRNAPSPHTRLAGLDSEVKNGVQNERNSNVGDVVKLSTRADQAQQRILERCGPL
jgi:hypothetical protein